MGIDGLGGLIADMGITEGVPADWTVAQKNGFAGHIANSVGFVQEPGLR